MSEIENRSTLVNPNWITFEDMKEFAKKTACNAIDMELSEDEVFDGYFSTFAKSEMLVDCMNLVQAYVRYGKDKRLKEETKKATADLRLKWEERVKASDVDVSSNEEYDGTYENVATNEENDGTYEDVAFIKENDVTYEDITTNDAENISGDKEKSSEPNYSKNPTAPLQSAPNNTQNENNQLSLMIPGNTAIDEEEQKKLKQQITNLKKKMKPLNLEYDSSKSFEENEKSYEEFKKASDDADKEKKEIETLTKNMTELELVYDESLPYDQNNELYKSAKDKKENPSYKYPFKIYFKGCDIRQLDNIFQENQQYTTKEICTSLFKHGYKEYAGEVKLEYDKDENMFIPDFTSQRHG